MKPLILSKPASRKPRSAKPTLTSLSSIPLDSNVSCFSTVESEILKPKFFGIMDRLAVGRVAERLKRIQVLTGRIRQLNGGTDISTKIASLLMTIEEISVPLLSCLGSLIDTRLLSNQKVDLPNLVVERLSSQLREIREVLGSVEVMKTLDSC